MGTWSRSWTRRSPVGWAWEGAESTKSATKATKKIDFMLVAWPTWAWQRSMCCCEKGSNNHLKAGGFFVCTARVLLSANVDFVVEKDRTRRRGMQERIGRCDRLWDGVPLRSSRLRGNAQGHNGREQCVWLCRKEKREVVWLRNNNKVGE